MVTNDQEPDQFFSCAHIINTCRLCIHSQLLGDLAESISQEGVNLVKFVLVRAVLVFVTTFASWDSILIDHAVSEVAECVIQDNWRPDILGLSDFACRTSVEALDSKFIEMGSLCCTFEV